MTSKDAMAELAAKRVTWIDPEPLRNHMPLVDYAGRRFDDAEIRFAFSHPKLDPRHPPRVHPVSGGLPDALNRGTAAGAEALRLSRRLGPQGR